MQHISSYSYLAKIVVHVYLLCKYIAEQNNRCQCQGLKQHKLKSILSCTIIAGIVSIQTEAMGLYI